MGDFFPTFVAKLQGQKVLQNSPNKRLKKILMLQNELLRITRSSHSLSIIYLRVLHFRRSMDEPCERLKRCSYQKLLLRETARLFTSDDPESCFTLACVKARESI